MTINLSDATWSALCDEYLVGEHESPADREQATINAFQLSQHLGQLVVFDPRERLHYSGVVWEPVDNSEPYDGLDALSDAFTEYFRHGYPVQVSDCYHDHPVFTRVGNLRFRVWHDTGHYLRHQDFSRTGELSLFVSQARQLGGRTLVDALFSESVYQLAASITLGTFPDEQYVRTPGPVARALLDAWGL